MQEGATLAMQDPALIEMQEKTAEQEGEQSPSGEFAGISTQQWNRNRKAVQKVLEELASGVSTEQAARVFLGTVGLNQASIDLLIEDAMDGQVDTPEVLNDAA
jgi:hypothetical protein